MAISKKTLDEIKYLEKIADLDDDLCDGDCDLEKPYLSCDICESRHSLNEAYEIIHVAYNQLNNLIQYRHSGEEYDG